MASTIRDVARVAGVSVATVSRALNGATNVLPETRERILQAARELRFTPSGAARSLITRRTDTIGALLPDLHGEYFSELIRGIDQAARARGLHLLLSSSHGDAHEAAAALRAMSGRVDGLLVMTPHADADFLQHKVPRILKRDFSPVSWPGETEHEWCPPGHGDIYPALETSGLLAQLLAMGFEYAFVSNSDNLGAVLEPGHRLPAHVVDPLRVGRRAALRADHRVPALTVGHADQRGLAHVPGLRADRPEHDPLLPDQRARLGAVGPLVALDLLRDRLPRARLVRGVPH